MRRKVLARSVRSVVEQLESRTLLSAVLNEAAGTGSITGLVYNDLNGTGHQDPGDPTVSGTSVTLSQVGVVYNGAPPTVQADSTGAFSFIGLAPGQYVLALLPDAGFSADAPGRLLVTVSANDAVNINIGETTNLAAGGTGSGTISGTLFNDLNQNGNYEPASGEQFLSGDTVFLDLNGNGILDAGEPSTITDNLGTFTFNVAAGSYQVVVTPRPGFHQDPPGYLQINVGSSDSIVANLGENSRSTISGTVFQDLNGNGVLDAGEPVVSGDTVFLDDNLNGTLDAGEVSGVTNGSGQFLLTNLSPGFHRIKIVSNAGLIQDGFGYVDVTLGANQDLVVNLGEGLPSTVTGVVFNDRNGNGAQDFGDAGLVGQTVFVDLTNNGILDSPSFAITAVSEIDNVTTVTALNNFFAGESVTVSGVTPSQYDGAFAVLTATPTSFTYYNTPGLPAATVVGTVSGPGGQVPVGPDMMPITGGEPATETIPANSAAGTPDGFFSIGNLGPGTYTLRLQVPEEAKPTGPVNASHSYTFTLGSAQTLATQNFGIQSPDLTVNILSLPTRPVFAGALQKAILRVTNVGSLTATGTADLSLYSQTVNTQINLSNVGLAGLIGILQDTPIHLRPGQSKVLPFLYRFPVQTLTNMYYVTAGVSSTSADNNTVNNFTASKGPISVTTPFIDLSAKYLTQPAPLVDPGTSTVLTLAIQNLGNVTTVGAINVRTYITVNPQLEPTDQVTHVFQLGQVKIAPGHTKIFYLTLLNPVTVTGLGYRYVILAVDSGDPLGEMNLTNNIVIPIASTQFA